MQPGMISAMQLLLYTAAWCRDCREAKRFLDKHGIAYIEIDIETTPGAAEDLLRNVGKRAIPQFVIDGKWVQPYRPGRGFLYAEMSELLGITSRSSV
jgi:mycoredoxin